MEQDERIKAVADEAWVSMLGDLEAVGVKLQRVSVAAGDGQARRGRRSHHTGS